jgi:hypothetical protein
MKITTTAVARITTKSVRKDTVSDEPDYDQEETLQALRHHASAARASMHVWNGVRSQDNCSDIEQQHTAKHKDRSDAIL